MTDSEDARAALEKNGLTTHTTVLHAYKAYKVAHLSGTSVEAAGHTSSARAWEEFDTFAG